jgi:Ser/Thr protein kinase RdoA (MazF antagonist)
MNKRNKARISPKQMHPNTIQEFVKDVYGLSTIKMPFLMNGGVENAGWLIETAEKFVVKVFAEDGDRVASIYEETYLYEYLNSCELYAPQVIMTSKGSLVGLLTIDSCDYPAVMMKLEELRRLSPLTITPHEVKGLAHTIARMHRVLKTHPRWNQIPRIDLPHSSSITTGGFDDLLSSPNASVFNEDELSNARAIDDKLIFYIETHLINVHLTTSILHGDLSLGHAQLLPNGKWYLFDFSDFSLGPIVWELATLLVSFYKQGGLSFHYWLKLKQYFLECYEDEMALSANDLSALKFCLLDRILFEIRFLNDVSKTENRLVDAEGNKKRYILAGLLLEIA